MELTKSSYIHGHINCKVGEYKLEPVEGRDAESLGRSWKRSFQCMLPVELWMVLPPPGLIYDCVLSIANWGSSPKSRVVTGVSLVSHD